MKNTKQFAYTIIELSIVITIIAVLMTGALSISVGSLAKLKKTATERKINEIYDAIGKFLLVNKRLPCPARLDITPENVNFGREVGIGAGCDSTGVYQSSVSGMGNIFYGMVPFLSLGLSYDYAQDDFGSKFSFIIDQRFTKNYQNTPDFANNSFGTVANINSIITIHEKPSATTQVITNDAIMIILSHGLNKKGAFNFETNSQNSRSSDVDEQNNDYASNYDNIFVASSQNSEIFDDIMIYKTRNQIVEDFDAFYLIGCNDAGTAFGNKSAYYDQIIYANSSCAGLTYTKLPEKYCDKYGNWVEINKCGNW